MPSDWSCRNVARRTRAGRLDVAVSDARRAMSTVQRPSILSAQRSVCCRGGVEGSHEDSVYKQAQHETVNSESGRK